MTTSDQFSTEVLVDEDESTVERAYSLFGRGVAALMFLTLILFDLYVAVQIF